jgi:hypothetical protein
MQKCIICKEPCATCNLNNAELCISCSDDRVLHLTNCLTQCPVNYQAINKTCQEVKDISSKKEIKVNLVQDKQRTEILYLQFSDAIPDLMDKTKQDYILSNLKVIIKGEK